MEKSQTLFRAPDNFYIEGEEEHGSKVCAHRASQMMSKSLAWWGPRASHFANCQSSVVSATSTAQDIRGHVLDLLLV